MSRVTKDELTAHDLVILSVITEKPIHGYGLNQTLQERDVQDWAAMSKPQIYYSLKKLQKKKLVHSNFLLHVTTQSNKKKETKPN